MRFIDRDEVSRRLTYQVCIPLMRDAMVALSRGETLQRLRTMLPLSEARLFGIMPGALGAEAPFGAKLISVFHDNFAKGIQSHQGVVVLFDPVTGAPLCVAHAGEITAIRTAAASAAATDALARKDARRLALLGYGEQARTHAQAIAGIRSIEEIVVWGRSPQRAQRFVDWVHAELGIACRFVAKVPLAVAQADIICTLTSAAQPILQGAWVRPGTHVNVVGSSHAVPIEVDDDLVVRSRYLVDSRASVLAAGAEFLHARAAGLIGDPHIAGEIGQVFAGAVAGRRTRTEITIYKSLGHIVQDLASAWYLYSTPA